jgi:hypothetical protein
VSLEQCNVRSSPSFRPRTETAIGPQNSGDDEAAKAIVLKLVDELGFDGVDADLFMILHGLE